jgi:transposase-like protein
MPSSLDHPIYKDENAARAHLEAIRWPDGKPVCPHCGVIDNATRLQGKSTRPGVWKCREKFCRKPFSATVGTVFERSKIPLTKWLMAAHLMASSKKGISSHQIHRTLGVTYKTAWFMTHRLRLAMDQPAGVFGSGGGIVEADETYIGKVEGSMTRKQLRAAHKAGQTPSSRRRPWSLRWWIVAARSARAISAARCSTA